MKIPLVDLHRQHQPLVSEFNEVFNKILKQGNFILGQEVNIFEKDFSSFCQARHGIGVASGTDALHLALKAVGVGRGDFVLTTANTFIATALAIKYTGANVGLIDVDETSFNLNPETLEEVIIKSRKDGNRITAIIPVHLYGRPCQMDKIMKLAAQYDLKIVEDACQAHGAECPDYNGNLKRVGNFGHAGCFSFFPGKNLGGMGDGGAIVTNSKKIAEKIHLLRNYGSIDKYIHKIPGGNSRLDTIQAALLTIKLKKLEQWNNERIRLAQYYCEKVSANQCLQDKIVLPVFPQKGKHVYHLFVVRVPKRDELVTYLHSKNIFAGIHYPIPIHLQEAFEDLGYVRGDFPVAEKMADEILSLPLFPGMKENEVDIVIKEIENFYCLQS